MPRREKKRRLHVQESQSMTKDSKHQQYFNGKRAIHNFGAGDSFYIPDFIHRKDQPQIFCDLLKEIAFVQMFNFDKAAKKAYAIPRMVSAQTTKDGGPNAIYRMPGCNESNIQTKKWTDNVATVAQKASEELKQDFNHCVCTLYRDENDSLGMHHDKILDLEDNSLILSVSFGATRPIVFVGTKAKSKTEVKQTLMLQPGSLLAIGPKTNRMFQHGIPKVDEKVGPRISLTLRTIKTFVSEDDVSGFQISGQGEEFQTKNYPFIKSHDNPEEYDDEAKQALELLKQESEKRLEHLRSLFSTVEACADVNLIDDGLDAPEEQVDEDDPIKDDDI